MFALRKWLGNWASHRGLAFAAALTAASLAPIGSSANAAAPCSAACLRGFVDAYLAAMVKHDASGLSFTESPAVTVNLAPVGRSNAGLWNSATAVGPYKEYIVDPEAGQVSFITAMKEGARSAILTGRLKIEDGKIAEVELIVARDRADTGAHFGPDTLSGAEPAISAVVPVAQRASRDELIRIARATWTTGGDKNLFEPGCRHYEEGELVGDPTACPSVAGSPIDPTVRVPVADVERGLVVSYALAPGKLLATGFFIPDSMLRDGDMGLGKPRPNGIRTMPGTAYVMQILKVVNGKIRTSQAFMNITAPGATSPWTAK